MSRVGGYSSRGRPVGPASHTIPSRSAHHSSGSNRVADLSSRANLGGGGPGTGVMRNHTINNRVSPSSSSNHHHHHPRPPPDGSGQSVDCQKCCIERYVLLAVLLIGFIIVLVVLVVAPERQKARRLRRRWGTGRRYQRAPAPVPHFLLRMDALARMEDYTPCDTVYELLNSNFTASWNKIMNDSSIRAGLEPSGLRIPSGFHFPQPLYNPATGKRFSESELAERRAALLGGNNRSSSGAGDESSRDDDAAPAPPSTIPPPTYDPQKLISSRLDFFGQLLNPSVLKEPLPQWASGFDALQDLLEEGEETTIERIEDGELTAVAVGEAQNHDAAHDLPAEPPSTESREAKTTPHHAGKNVNSWKKKSKSNKAMTRVHVAPVDKKVPPRSTDGSPSFPSSSSSKTIGVMSDETEAAFAKLGWGQPPPDWCTLQQYPDPSTVSKCVKSQEDRIAEDPVPFTFDAAKFGLEPKSEPYTMIVDCPLIRKVICPAPPVGEDSKIGALGPQLSKGRALVMYMFHLGEYEAESAEWGNFEYFWKFAVYDSGKADLQLFDGVDYVFYRVNTNVEKVTECSEFENIRFLWVPAGPCDLCSHGLVLEHLGFDREKSTAETWPYRTVVFMNSGVRGPFLNKQSSSWIDVISIGRSDAIPISEELDDMEGYGTMRTPNGRKQFYDFSDFIKFRTVWGVLFNLGGLQEVAQLNQMKPHAQSYFLNVPVGVLGEYMESFLFACERVKVKVEVDPETKIATINRQQIIERFINSRKQNCISNTELRTVETALRANFDVYFSMMSRTVTNMSHASIEKKAKEDAAWSVSSINPTTAYNDPCKGIFLKFGGNVLRQGSLPAKTLKAVNRLTSYFSSGRPRASSRLLRPVQILNRARKSSSSSTSRTRSDPQPPFCDWLSFTSGTVMQELQNRMVKELNGRTLREMVDYVTPPPSPYSSRRYGASRNKRRSEARGHNVPKDPLS